MNEPPWTMLKVLATHLREAPRATGSELHDIDEGIVVAAFRLASKEDTERVAKMMQHIIAQIGNIHAVLAD